MNSKMVLLAVALLLLLPAARATVVGSGSGHALGFPANPVTNTIAMASTGTGLDLTDHGLDAIDTAISFGAWAKWHNSGQDSTFSALSLVSYEDPNLLQPFGEQGWAFKAALPRWEQLSVGTSSSTAPILWEWHHYFLSWDGNTATVFLDGKPAGSVMSGSGVSLKAQTNLILTLGIIPYGGWGAGTTVTSKHDISFQGVVDEVTVWSRALCADEVALIWNVSLDTSRLPDGLVSISK